MMTSVTLPSSSGPNIHGGFSDAPAAGDFEPPRPPKRCLSTPPVDTCKKRRKQATPVRISATDSPPTSATTTAEGKPPSPDECDLSPSDSNTTTDTTTPTNLQCPVCQLPFAAPDQLQLHLATEHMCKREPIDSSPPPQETEAETDSDSQTASGNINNPHLDLKQELPPWLPDIPGKEWMNPGLLGFPGNSLFMTGMGLPPFANQPDAMPPRQPIRIFNPDAYCELCNKEFCNKYFLKTHKANKHGIYEPPADSHPTSSNSSIPSVTIPSYVNHMKLPPGLPTSLDLAVKMEKTYDMFPFGKMFGKTPELPTTELSVQSGELDTKPQLSTCQPPPLQQHQDESSSPRIQNETTSNSMSVKNDFDRTAGPDQEPFYTSPGHPGQSSQQQANLQIPKETYQELSARLRRIGVMNPKAFCEICCKEYCNKYFLRTHKMKRHGIFIPDDREDIKFNKDTNPYTQTSPLNLIMGEQSSNSSDRKTSSPSDISCEICGIKFQNASLFQLHNVSVHSKLPDPPQLFTPTSDIKKLIEDKPANSAASSSADSISEDLQKLQTMILQLNDLDVSKVAATCSTCSTCGKDFENRYYLQAHMMTEHNLLLDDNEPDKPETEADANSNLNSNPNNNTICELCGKDCGNFEDMKKHLYEHHQKPGSGLGGLPGSGLNLVSGLGLSADVKEEYNGFTTPEKTPRSGIATPVNQPSGPERRTSMNLTPTSSYCEICNKELCNKYFMKTHMQRMHGIEIENGAQIGGVICDICNKELCSKYFLRVHKHNTHGIVEYGSNLMGPKRFDEAGPGITPPSSMPAPPQALEDPSLKPTDLADLSHRYFSHFNEVCPLCARRFRSTKWLKAHLLSDHGPAGAEKWSELEAQLQQSLNQSKPGSKSVSPTIKVPNQHLNPNPNQNLSVEVMLQQQQQQKMQNVLSTIFGADADANKTYHCSYCPFTTPVLPFLFVHERSHAESSQASNSGPSQESGSGLKCPVCMQSFAQPDQLQHHVFTQHPFLPLPPFFNGFNGSHDVSASGDASKEPSECADADDVEATDSTDLTKEKLSPKTSKKVSLKHKSDQINDVVEKDLKEMARKSQIPAAYAIPTDEDGANAASPRDYVMQPFLIEESTNVLAVPSIVYLPVASKVSQPITATFTLTPA